MENDDVENSKDDIAIHFQKGDVQLMIDALSLMGATLMVTSVGQGARERLQHLLEQFERLSPLPGYHGSYADSAQFMYACKSVKSCDQWEVVLKHAEKSIFNDVSISIETVKQGKKAVFNLSSELHMGLGQDNQDAMEKYGVYMSRLVDMCQELAPLGAVQIAQEKMRLVIDARSYTYDKSLDCETASLLIGGRLDFPVVVRDIKRVMWKDGDGLPPRTTYVNVVVAAPVGKHASISQVLEELTAENMRSEPTSTI